MKTYMLKQPWHFTSCIQNSKNSSIIIIQKKIRLNKGLDLQESTYHEEWVGRLYETLELVLSLLKLSRRIEQIDVVLKNLSIGRKKVKLVGSEYQNAVGEFGVYHDDQKGSAWIANPKIRTTVRERNRAVRWMWRKRRKAPSRMNI